MTEELVRIDYTNHRGERAVRTVWPIRIHFGSNRWHPEPQWILEAYDMEPGRGGAHRSFAVKDIHAWLPAPAIDGPRCTHPDRGATVAVTCPACHSPIRLPADLVDHAADRHCPVCNAQLPYLPETPKP